MGASFRQNVEAENGTLTLRHIAVTVELLAEQRETNRLLRELLGRGEGPTAPTAR